MTEFVVWAWRDKDFALLAKGHDEFCPVEGTVETYPSDALWPLVADLPNMGDEESVKLKVRVTRAR